MWANTYAYLDDRHDGDCGHDRSVKEGEFPRVQRGRIYAVGADEHARQAEHSAERIHGAPEIGEPAARAEVKHDGPGSIEQKDAQQKRSTRARRQLGTNTRQASAVVSGDCVLDAENQPGSENR